MSNRSGQVSAEECVSLGGVGPRLDAYPNRQITLGDLTVSRALPIREQRMVGPWCFLDRFGPFTFGEGKPMDVAPHPHIGLQTVTWLLEGEVMHDDSLGCESILRPGSVNVMTAGGGIAHAEQTPLSNSGRLNGVQLWVALPNRQRHVAASFSHIDDVPALELAGGIVRVFSGGMPGAVSSAPHFSELVGMDIELHRRGRLEVPLEASFEHAALVLAGDCAFEGQELEAQALYYLGTGRGAAEFSSRAGARLLLIGGPPCKETILMWWNFVARTPEEIASARADWEAHQRFGEVKAYRGPRLAAPALARLARANPMS